MRPVSPLNASLMTGYGSITCGTDHVLIACALELQAGAMCDCVCILPVCVHTSIREISLANVRGDDCWASDAYIAGGALGDHLRGEPVTSGVDYIYQ